jgi:lipooligosaccharide transport system ATP-binding protein
MAAIQWDGVSKHFRSRPALSAVSFAVPEGACVGLLGPNGAGKTTALRLALGFCPADAGTVRMRGRSPEEPTSRVGVGYLPERLALPPRISVGALLELHARLAGLAGAAAHEAIDAALTQTGIADRRRDACGSLSKGLAQRVGFALAFLGAPEVLILDEPTTGLDPQARHLLWDRLYRLKQEGVTLIITTHYMDEAEQLCDRLVIMDKGKIVGEGSPRSLIEEHSTREVVELRFPPGTQERILDRMEGLGKRLEILPDRVLIYADDADETLGEVHRRGLETETTLVRRSTLEDVFLHLTGRSLVE